MQAMVLDRIGDVHPGDQPLTLREVDTPEPDAHEILIKISACGVCHTELDEIEGRTAPPILPVIPGHQVVGRVASCGLNAKRHRLGDRVGVGWIYQSDGGLQENLSPRFRATGRDANGGYAEYMTIDERYAYPIPTNFSDEQAAPLLCAGAIGFRSLRLTQIRDGEPLGLAGFGSSAHLVLQLARHLHPRTEIFVFARDPLEREFASGMGAEWTGDFEADAPLPLQAIIDTTPAWVPVLHSLANLRGGGRLVINAIRKQASDQRSLLQLDYAKHLWMEREIKSVANITSHDIADFLPIAAQIPIRPKVETYALPDANRALVELKRGSIQGSKVLVM